VNIFCRTLESSFLVTIVLGLLTHLSSRINIPRQEVSEIPKELL
jgi:hypothetical protein